MNERVIQEREFRLSVDQQLIDKKIEKRKKNPVITDVTIKRKKLRREYDCFMSIYHGLSRYCIESDGKKTHIYIYIN